MPGVYIGFGRGMPSPPPESHNSDLVLNLSGAQPNLYATPTVVVRNNGTTVAAPKVEMCWAPATTGAVLTGCRKFGTYGTLVAIDVAPINPGAASSPQQFINFKVVTNAVKLVARIVADDHSHLANAAETCSRCGVQVLP